MKMTFRSCVALLLLVTRTMAWTWKPLASTNKAPRVSGHSVATTPDNRVLLFGGLTGAAGSPTVNDLWSFGNDHWNKLEQKQGPGRRMYSASAILNGSLYLFGGWDPGEPGSGGTFLDYVWRLDLTSMEWHTQENLPCGPVSRHSACTVGDSIIVHTFRGVFVYNKDGECTQQETTGEGPEGLSMCAVTPLDKNSMLLFGGSTKTQELSSNAFVLDTSTWKWRKLDIKGDGPCARASPCAAPLSINKCIVFGGASLGTGGYEGGAGLVPQDDTWILDAKECTWNKVESDVHPEGRVAATLSPLGESGKFLLQGGYDPISKGTYEEPWMLVKE